MYSALRVLDPTGVELKEANERVRMLKKLWTKARLPDTPKVHEVSCHAVSEMKRVGGYGDKNNKPVEKYHQVQKQMDGMLFQMRPGKEGFAAQQRYEACANCGQVKKQKEMMYRNSSHKKKACELELDKTKQIRRLG